MLAEVFDSDGLILCELVDRGILDNLPPEDLAELFSWFSFDREFRYGNRFILPDRLVLARRRIEDVEHAVLSEERGEGLAISEGHNPNFYGAARAWSRGATMAEIGAQIELSEGDLVMTFNKTIDLMRQVWEMLVNVKPEHPLRTRLQQAESLLRRDIVEHSLALGFAPIELPEIARGELEAAKAAQPAAPRRRTRPAPGTIEPAPDANGPRGKSSEAREPTADDNGWTRSCGEEGRQRTATTYVRRVDTATFETVAIAGPPRSTALTLVLAQHQPDSQRRARRGECQVDADAKSVASDECARESRRVRRRATSIPEPSARAITTSAASAR